MSFQGLGHLSKIGRKLSIRDNSRLVSLQGLGYLSKIGGTVEIVGNRALSSMQGINESVSISEAAHSVKLHLNQTRSSFDLLTL